MLHGQEIGLSDSLWVSLLGMGVVMLGLCILALFVWIIARTINMLAADKKAAQPAAQPTAQPAAQPAPQPAAAAPAVTLGQADTAVNPTELAAALAASFAELGVTPGGNDTLVISAEKHIS